MPAQLAVALATLLCALVAGSCSSGTSRKWTVSCQRDHPRSDSSAWAPSWPRWLRALDVDGADESTRRSARQRVEPRWNGWTTIWTALAILTVAIMVTLLIRL
jgi:hypothetical protein